MFGIYFQMTTVKSMSITIMLIIITQSTMNLSSNQSKSLLTGL